MLTIKKLFGRGVAVDEEDQDAFDDPVADTDEEEEEPEPEEDEE